MSDAILDSREKSGIWQLFFPVGLLHNEAALSVLFDAFSLPPRSHSMSITEPSRLRRSGSQIVSQSSTD